MVLETMFPDKFEMVLSGRVVKAGPRVFCPLIAAKTKFWFVLYKAIVWDRLHKLDVA
jgi:hypothetical protein